MRGYLLWLPLLLSPLAQAMQALDDASLSAVSGQAGITLETTGGGWDESTTTPTKVNYTQDGQTLSLVGVSNKPQSSSAVSTSKFDVVGDQLQIEHKPAAAQFKVESIRMNGSSASFGSLNALYTLDATLLLKGANIGAQGLRITPNVTLSSSLLQYQDQGVLRAESFVGALSSTKGLTLDVATDGSGQYANIAFEDLKLNASLGGLIIGNPNDSTNPANPTTKKLGRLAFNLNFANGLADGVNRQNELKLRGGGDSAFGLEGVTTELSWNLANSSVSLTDDNNSIFFSGLRSYGKGDFSFDLTGNGLRFGLKDVKGSYSFDGLQVGSAAAPLQGGTELLVLAEIFPAYDFTLNGQLTIKPGGFVAAGYNADGFGYNADFDIKDAKAALTVDENGKGLWLTGTSYDMHYRDGSLDVTNNGIELRKGTYWSTLDVSDVRWGYKDSVSSLGRIVLKRYEIGSMLTLSSGGAGPLCIGYSATNQGACEALGADNKPLGRWEERGNEGLTVKLKNVFVKDSTGSPSDAVATNEKRNQLIIETNRGAGGNGTGSQLVLDNFYTSDGSPSNPADNTYGFNADLNIDVAPTRVRDKAKTDGSYLSPEPLGFAVNGRIHFKEFNVERLQNVHPTSGVGGVPGAVTAMYGIKAQNANIGVNLTATPIN